MIGLLPGVHQAQVEIAGNTIAAIGRGLLVAVERGDSKAQEPNACWRMLHSSLLQGEGKGAKAISYKKFTILTRFDHDVPFW
jgi:D-Tyr-tRNAtyr deacylase